MKTVEMTDKEYSEWVSDSINRYHKRIQSCLEDMVVYYDDLDRVHDDVSYIKHAADKLKELYDIKSSKTYC